MQRVIGLDIGSYSIKAVEIINTFNSYEIINFYENVIPSLDNLSVGEIAPAVMEQLFLENNLHADRIVTAMPGQFISSRLVTLGFSDPRKVKASVIAEIEEAVPFQLDDMVFDHQILSTSGNQTIALAVMTRKHFLANFLELLQRINIDPKLVDVDSLAFYNLSTQLGIGVDNCIAMVDVGHEKTSVCIVKNGVLRMFRSINLGGRYITDFLARDLEISFQEAQRIKHKYSKVICEGGNEDLGDEESERAIRGMTLATQAITKELGRTFYAFKSWEKSPIHKVYLSGGSSKISNLEGLLEEQLQTEVLKYDVNNSELKIADPLIPYMASIPQSVAIGIRAVSSVKKSSQINLRTGEFAYVQSYSGLFESAVQGLKAAAIILVMLFASYGLKKYVYQKHIDKIQQEYKKEYLSLMPQEKKIFRSSSSFRSKEKKATQKLTSRIASMKSAVSDFKDQNKRSSALRALLNLSLAIPKSVIVDVRLFDFKKTEGQEQLIIQAETEGYAQMSAFVDNLKKSNNFTDVLEKKSAIKAGSEGKIVQFTVTATPNKG